MQVSDILQLLQESDLLHVVLQPIHPCEPPATTSTDSTPSCDRVRLRCGLVIDTSPDCQANRMPPLVPSAGR
jgi:hypothetical protein